MGVPRGTGPLCHQQSFAFCHQQSFASGPIPGGPVWPEPSRRLEPGPWVRRIARAIIERPSLKGDPAA
jgi:hypothetical protein